MTADHGVCCRHCCCCCLSDVRVERQRSTDAAAGFSQKQQHLQHQLEEARSGKAAALLEQQEQFQQQKHQLQALLSEAEEQLERQRRELSAGFLLQAQQIEAKHAAATADARAEAATAAALAQTRAGEAAAAHEQAVERLRQVEVRALLLRGCVPVFACAPGLSEPDALRRAVHMCVSVAAWADRWGRSTLSCCVLQAAQLQAQEAEASVKALRVQADQSRQQTADQQAQLEAQLAAVKQELQRTTTAHEVQVGSPARGGFQQGCKALHTHDTQVSSPVMSVLLDVCTFLFVRLCCCAALCCVVLCWSAGRGAAVTHQQP